MNHVYLDLESKEVETSTTLTETFKELRDHYKGNDQILSYTFPMLVLKEPRDNLKDQLIGKEGELYFYTDYPWKYILIDGR